MFKKCKLLFFGRSETDLFFLFQDINDSRTYEIPIPDSFNIVKENLIGDKFYHLAPEFEKDVFTISVNNNYFSINSKSSKKLKEIMSRLCVLHSVDSFISDDKEKKLLFRFKNLTKNDDLTKHHIPIETKISSNSFTFKDFPGYYFGKTFKYSLKNKALYLDDESYTSFKNLCECL